MTKIRKITLIFLLIIVIFGFLSFMIYAIATIPPCLEYENNYYWKTWAGNFVYVGTNLEEAKELAGNKSLGIEKKCVKSLTN